MLVWDGSVEKYPEEKHLDYVLHHPLYFPDHTQTIKTAIKIEVCCLVLFMYLLDRRCFSV